MKVAGITSIISIIGAGITGVIQFVDAAIAAQGELKEFMVVANKGALVAREYGTYTMPAVQPVKVENTDETKTA